MGLATRDSESHEAGTSAEAGGRIGVARTRVIFTTSTPILCVVPCAPAILGSAGRWTNGHGRGHLRLDGAGGDALDKVLHPKEEDDQQGYGGDDIGRRLRPVVGDA